jgi:hypothetical protein
MKSRDELISLVQSLEPSATYSAKELAGFIGVPLGTMNGWLSDRRAFPPREIGSRRSRVYDEITLKRLAVYLGATRQGLGWNGNDVKLLITNIDPEDAWSYYCNGMSDLASFLVEKRVQIIGE